MHTSEKVWEEYHSRLRAFITRRISDDTAAEDVLQNIFLKMHTALPSLKDAQKLQSWLYQITRNAVIDYYRLQKPTVDFPEWLTEPVPDSGEKAIQELSSCLQPMIQMLPEIYRETIILSELQGMKAREVAHVQGISLTAAKSRVRRGRALLKEMLADCCRLEFDLKGRLCDYEQKDGTRNFC